METLTKSQLRARLAQNFNEAKKIDRENTIKVIKQMLNADLTLYRIAKITDISYWTLRSWVK